MGIMKNISRKIILIKINKDNMIVTTNFFKLETKNFYSDEPNAKLKFQRLRAKDQTWVFNSIKKNENIQNNKPFGWTSKNEITNGRWVMFGLLIGFLTEYATGVSLVDQIKLTISYTGIYDLDD